MSKKYLLRMSAACVAIIMIMPSLSSADNAVDVGITSYDQHDTIWATWPSTFDIYIENDVPFAGISLGHQFWSPDGAVWRWGDSYGWIWYPHPSRWYGMSCFDMAGPGVGEHDIDEVGRDTMYVWGQGMHGCDPGPLELMYSYNFMMEEPADDAVLNMCIDSCFIPPSGAFVFLDFTYDLLVPITLWESGGACWPVKMFPYVCGDANFDRMLNVGDIVFMIAYVFAGGPAPNPYCQGDVNDNGYCTYRDLGNRIDPAPR